MPKLSLYPNGCTAGVAPSSTRSPRALRDVVAGWSATSCRNNTKFLYSVHAPDLSGQGIAVTLTLKDCPPTSDHWHRIRRKLEHRLRRLGLIRGHWVTEWQRRGVPHLHGALYFPQATPGLRTALVDAWLKVAADCRPGRLAQYILPITDAVGWFGYVSKHAARGVGHYQRSPENVPKAWQSKTGRVWGKIGDWPTRDAAEVELSMPEYWRFRRIVRGWRCADARKEGGKRRILSARGMLRCHESHLSAVRGVSEWLGFGLSFAMLAAVAVRTGVYTGH